MDDESDDEGGDSGTTDNGNQAPLETVEPDTAEEDGDAWSGRPKRPCYFCQEMQSQLARHLQRKHKDEPEVQHIMSLEGDEKVEALADLRKRAILQKNSILAKQTAEPDYLRERRQGGQDLVICGTCSGFYSRKKLWQHKQRCGKHESSVTLPSQSVPASTLSIPEDKTKLGKEFRSQILERFRDDEIGKVCRTDTMIVVLGKRLYSKYNDRKIAMSNMRRLGLLLIKFRETANDSTLAGESMLDRKNFAALEDALDHVSRANDGSLKAALKLALGYQLKKCVKTMKGYNIMHDKLERNQEIDYFQSLLDLNWDCLFGRSQLQVDSRRQDVLRRPARLPLEADVSKIKDFVTTSIAEMVNNEYLVWGQYEYIRMRALLVCRLTLFNCRRGGEPSKLKLKEWEDGERGVWIDKQMVENINDPIEKALLDKFKLMYQAGKNNKLVPVLVPLDTMSGIRKLVEARQDAGVNPQNIFLFANTENSLTHVDGWPCVREVCKKASVSNANLITATRYRHRASTYYALLDTTEEKRRVFYRHMGHGEPVNRDVYQCPLAIREITTVGPYLESIDGLDLSNQKKS